MTEELRGGRSRADRAARHMGRREVPAPAPPPAPDPRAERIRELEHLIEVERRQIELERLHREAVAARVVPPAAPGETTHQRDLRLLIEEHALLEAQEKRDAAREALAKATRDAATAARAIPTPAHERNLHRLKEVEADITAANKVEAARRATAAADRAEATAQEKAFEGVDFNDYKRALEYVRHDREGRHMDAAQQRGLARGLAKQQEAWKGAPLWKRLAAGALMVGAATLSGGLASLLGLSWLAAPVTISAVAGVTNAVMTGHYLSKRRVANPWFWGAIAGAGTFASSFILNALIPTEVPTEVA